MNQFWQKAGTEAVCIGLIAVFFLPLCGFLMGCGCTYLWAGGIHHCNIHDPAPPNCPWCSGPLWMQWIPFLVVCVAGYSGVRIIRRYKQKSFFRDLAAGLVSALTVAVILSWIYRANQ